MRPIERGDAPRIYHQYGEAIGDLTERLGSYCSYCERQLPANLAVEHMAPKSRYPDRELDWNNFLLGCVNCNSVKSNEDVADGDILWPDRHNTMLALAYSPGGFVRVAEGLSHGLKQRACVLINLVGLNRHNASGWPRPAKRDDRWAQREEVWTSAEKCRAAFEKLNGSNEALDLVLIAAKGYGFFSVWLTVFDRHIAVKRALIDAFPGTATSCFNARGVPINRPGSVL